MPSVSVFFGKVYLQEENGKKEVSWTRRNIVVVIDDPSYNMKNSCVYYLDSNVASDPMRDPRCAPGPFLSSLPEAGFRYHALSGIRVNAFACPFRRGMP